MNDRDPSSSNPRELWRGVRAEAENKLETRDYSRKEIAVRLADTGVRACEVFSNEGLEDAWIPAVEIFQRTVYHQRSRGYFAEMARTTEGPIRRVGLELRQWSVATMYSESAKGFHIHPPHIPEGEDPEAWLRRLYIEEPGNYSLRPYDKEQWDIMFFVRGIAEIVLVDERAGLSRRVMRFVIDGDDLPGPNNAGVVIPAGVAHAVRSCSSQDLIMVYGTSTTFEPEHEGRIASDIERAPLPDDWEKYLESSYPSATSESAGS